MTRRSSAFVIVRSPDATYATSASLIISCLSRHARIERIPSGPGGPNRVNRCGRNRARSLSESGRKSSETFRFVNAVAGPFRLLPADARFLLTCAEDFHYRFRKGYARQGVSVAVLHKTVRADFKEEGVVSKHLNARSGFVAVIALALTLLPGLASAQALIKVNDTVNFPARNPPSGLVRRAAARRHRGEHHRLPAEHLPPPRALHRGRPAREGRHLLLHDRQPEPRQGRRRDRKVPDHRVRRSGRLRRVEADQRMEHRRRPHSRAVLPQLSGERRDPRVAGLRHVVLPAANGHAGLGGP